MIDRGGAADAAPGAGTGGGETCVESGDDVSGDDVSGDDVSGDDVSGDERALQAVLFDLDGTLIDTEPYWIAAEYALVEAFGGRWSDEHAHALVGNALLSSADYIRSHSPVDLEPEQIVERLLDDVVAAAMQRMPWRPGAVELLASLRADGIACGLVTMSYARLADAVVAALPPGCFDVVVTGDQVLDGKPHPEAYLTAAARLNVAPERCIAIEDSPNGIASAEAAGCVVVAIPHVVPVTPAATRVLADSLSNLSATDLDALVRSREAMRSPRPGTGGPDPAR